MPAADLERINAFRAHRCLDGLSKYLQALQKEADYGAVITEGDSHGASRGLKRCSCSEVPESSSTRGPELA